MEREGTSEPVVIGFDFECFESIIERRGTGVDSAKAFFLVTTVFG
jgi:hypothetical protein